MIDPRSSARPGAAGLRLLTVAAVLASLVLPRDAGAQVVAERIDLAVAQRIRDEGLQRSQVAEVIGHLTDVIGPRLTGSTNIRRAYDWTADRMRSWGLANVRIEPWGRWGRGWERVSYHGRVVDPYPQPLHATPLAWSGSTNGLVTGRVMILEANDPADLAHYRGALAGAVVLWGAPSTAPVEWDARPRRYSLADLLERDWTPPPPAPPEERREVERRRALDLAIVTMLEREQIAALLMPSAWTYGILRVGAIPGMLRVKDSLHVEPVPALVVAHEQYGQLYRNVRRGLPVRVELDVRNRFLTDDLTAYNVIAELPGTDLADEVVMIGAHLDSWHTGTGATDNAAGSVVMMEAMRILRALGIQPRRTIRIGLWSGEEGGLWGSRGWVRRHADQLPRISAYLNIDNGTGRIRGIADQGNRAAAPIFEQIFSPLRDLGVVAVRRTTTGGTDHLAFEEAGVPGFNFTQDPIEYFVRTHHSNVDTFDHLVLDDLRQAATVAAWTAYQLAVRDDMMPRKPR